MLHHIDTLEFTNPLFRRLYSKRTSTGERDAGGTRLALRRLGQARSGRPPQGCPREAQHRSLRQAPGALRPDITVCTHFLPAEIISWLIGKGRLGDTAGDRRYRLRRPCQWLCPNYAHYFVAIDETRAHLEELGFRRRRSRSRASRRPRVRRPEDKSAMREKYGCGGTAP